MFKFAKTIPKGNDFIIIDRRTGRNVGDIVLKSGTYVVTIRGVVVGKTAVFPDAVRIADRHLGATGVPKRKRN